MRLVVEEVVVEYLLLVVGVFTDTEREDHVVDPLERRPRHPGVAFDEIEVLGERSRPVALEVSV